MPHAVFEYSADLSVDTTSLLEEVEATILRADDGSGDCKGRAYKVEEHHHSHAVLTVTMLAKPHRDESFRSALTRDLVATVSGYLPMGCFLSLQVDFAPKHYVTTKVDS